MGGRRKGSYFRFQVSRKEVVLPRLDGVLVIKPIEEVRRNMNAKVVRVGKNFSEFRHLGTNLFGLTLSSERVSERV